MPKIYNISEWFEEPWWNTGGTRNKKVYLNPDDNTQYYFKQSLKKDKKDYKYEFWSEIIASEIGLALGFDVLPYHLAIRGDEAGCLSKSMIVQGKEELVEGGKFIQGFDNTFNPDDRALRHQYDFDLVMGALDAFGLNKYAKDILEILVFDAIIGNSDRHQENWAIITEHTQLSKSFSEIEFELGHGGKNLPKWLGRIMSKIYLSEGSKKLKPGLERVRLGMAKNKRFAPIYDSGCSFGRELTDDRVIQILKDDEQLKAYINRGQGEIHWEKQKVSHFEMLKHILAEEDFVKDTKEIIGRVTQRLDGKALAELIMRVDVDLPAECGAVKIPAERKDLMCKLLLSRLDMVKSLL